MKKMLMPSYLWCMQLPKNLMEAMAEAAPPQGALTTAFERTSIQLNHDVSDDENSGAKVIAALVQGRNVHLAHIGDCSAVAAQKNGSRWKPAPPLQGVQSFSSLPNQTDQGLGWDLSPARLLIMVVELLHAASESELGWQYQTSAPPENSKLRLLEALHSCFDE